LHIAVYLKSIAEGGDPTAFWQIAHWLFPPWQTMTMYVALG